MTDDLDILRELVAAGEKTSRHERDLTGNALGRKDSGDAYRTLRDAQAKEHLAAKAARPALSRLLARLVDAEAKAEQLEADKLVQQFRNSIPLKDGEGYRALWRATDLLLRAAEAKLAGAMAALQKVGGWMRVVDKHHMQMETGLDIDAALASMTQADTIVGEGEHGNAANNG